MELYTGEFPYSYEPPGPRSPSPISLEEGKPYRLDVGLREGMRMPRVLLLWAPRIVMPQNELRAKCIVVDPGHSGLEPGAHIEPLAHCFRADS
jgi:N-acetylmuramoyl-L-alanine amidase